MEIPCEVAKDLLPLYADEVCSEKSKEFLQEHMNACEDCRKLYQSMKGGMLPEPQETKEAEESNLEEIKPFKKVKKRVYAVILGIVLGLSCLFAVGFLLTDFFIKDGNVLTLEAESTMFYNILEKTGKKMEQKWGISEKTTLLVPQTTINDFLEITMLCLDNKGQYSIYLYDEATDDCYQVEFFWEEGEKSAKVTVSRTQGKKEFVDTGISFLEFTDSVRTLEKTTTAFTGYNSRSQKTRRKMALFSLQIPQTKQEEYSSWLGDWLDSNMRKVDFLYSDGMLRQNCDVVDGMGQVKSKVVLGRFYLGIAGNTYNMEHRRFDYIVGFGE